MEHVEESDDLGRLIETARYALAPPKIKDCLTMPDITMCINKDCPLKAICYRATATPDPYWQSFCKYEYKNGKCDHFWDTSKIEKKGEMTPTDL